MKKPSKKRNLVRLHVSVEETSKKYLDRLSGKQGITLSECMRNIIRYYADATMK